MIAGARGDHPTGTLRRIERKQPVSRAALLEGACKLQVFELQPHARAGQPRKRGALAQGGAPDPPRDPGLRSKDVGESEHFAVKGSTLSEPRTGLRALTNPAKVRRIWRFGWFRR